MEDLEQLVDEVKHQNNDASGSKQKAEEAQEVGSALFRDAEPLPRTNCISLGT